MTIDNILDALRQSAPGCDLVGYADIKAELVLARKSARPVRQEYLDHVATTAAALFANASQDTDRAVLGVGERLFVFVRDPSEPDEVCFCDCETDADADSVEVAARKTLTQLHEGP